MSKNEKLVQRLLALPKDLTWKELVKLLTLFGYSELKKGKIGGSRKRFADDKKNLITLHKPHPGNIVKSYALKQVIDHLKEKGQIQNE